MERMMSATQARINFGEVLRYVAMEQPVIVEHSGKPQAVIIAVEAYQEYQSLKAERQQFTLDAVLKQTQDARMQTREELAGKTLPDVAEMIQQMREERDAQLDQALGLRG